MSLSDGGPRIGQTRWILGDGGREAVSRREIRDGAGAERLLLETTEKTTTYFYVCKANSC